MSVGHSGSGQALLNQGDYAGSLEEFRHVKAIHEHLIDQYPNDSKQPLALAFTQQTIGTLLSLQGDQAGAVEALRQSVALLRLYSGKLDNGQSKLASALGLLSGHYLLAGQFAEAKGAAEDGYSLDQKQLGILLNLALAEMFLGHTDAAMQLHVKHMNDVIPENGNKRWREVVVDDFAELKKRGLKSPNMINIEQLMTKKDD